MADDKRINELPPLGSIFGNTLFVVYDPFTDVTYRTPYSVVVPAAETTSSPVWDEDTIYPEGDIVTFDDQVWVSLDDDNEGNIPFEGSTFWELGNRAKSGLVDYAVGIFFETYVSVYNLVDSKREIFFLKNTDRPYNSTDFDAELAAGDWEQVTGIRRVEVDTSGGTIDFDCGNSGEILFTQSADIGGNKSFTFSNTASIRRFVFPFNLTGLHILSFPVGTKLNNITGFWDNGTRQWTPDIAGDYEIEAVFDQVTWRVKIIGPFT